MPHVLSFVKRLLIKDRAYSFRTTKYTIFHKHFLFIFYSLIPLVITAVWIGAELTFTWFLLLFQGIEAWLADGFAALFLFASDSGRHDIPHTNQALSLNIMWDKFVSRFLRNVLFHSKLVKLERFKLLFHFEILIILTDVLFSELIFFLLSERRLHYHHFTLFY